MAAKRLASPLTEEQTCSWDDNVVEEQDSDNIADDNVPEVVLTDNDIKKVQELTLAASLIGNKLLDYNEIRNQLLNKQIEFHYTSIKNLVYESFDIYNKKDISSKKDIHEYLQSKMTTNMTHQTMAIEVDFNSKLSINELKERLKIAVDNISLVNNNKNFKNIKLKQYIILGIYLERYCHEICNIASTSKSRIIDIYNEFKINDKLGFKVRWFAKLVFNYNKFSQLTIGIDQIYKYKTTIENMLKDINYQQLYR